MVRKLASNPGSTARFYRKNRKSAQKHSDDNNSGKNGKYAHSKAYKKEHAKARKRLGTSGTNYDASKRNGLFIREHSKTNRGRGGAQRT
tara:strand:- start:2373 stop:2639 length:267 start_codon:yes stop_codon:yes gene_type:complete